MAKFGTEAESITINLMAELSKRIQVKGSTILTDIPKGLFAKSTWIFISDFGTPQP